MLASLLLILLLYKLRLKQSTSDSKIKSKNINYIMTIIAVTNLLLAASIFIGQPHDGTFLCWIQAVTTNYFCLVHIFWSTMLAYTLFKAAKDLASTNVFSKLFIALGFVFPMVITLLPLTTNNYGNPDADRGWCFLDDRDDSPSKCHNDSHIYLDSGVVLFGSLLLPDDSYCVCVLMCTTRLDSTFLDVV